MKEQEREHNVCVFSSAGCISTQGQLHLLQVRGGDLLLLKVQYIPFICVLLSNKVANLTICEFPYGQGQINACL